MRRTPVAVLRHLWGLEKQSTDPDEEYQYHLIKSNVDVGDSKDGKKVDVILRLLETHKSHTMTWHVQAYVAATASIGLMVYIFNSYANLKSHSDHLTRVIYGAGIILFAILSRLYLRVAERNYRGNEKYVIRCEYALKLKDNGIFFVADPVADPAPKTEFYRRITPDKGMRPDDIILLTWSHLIVTIMLLVAIFSLK